MHRLREVLPTALRQLGHTGVPRLEESPQSQRRRTSSFIAMISTVIYTIILTLTKDILYHTYPNVNTWPARSLCWPSISIRSVFSAALSPIEDDEQENSSKMVKVEANDEDEEEIGIIGGVEG